MVRQSLSPITGCLLLISLLGISVTALAEQQIAGAEVAASEAAETPASEFGVSRDEGEVPEIEVEVLGTREGLLSISPAPGETVAEVDAQEIADSGSAYVMDAIELTPSVFVRHQGARYENRLSIRGAAPRLVLLDGIPIAREGYTGLGGGAGGKEAGFAGRILYTLPAGIIERIDVIRSAGTIVYGQTAGTGAVINIVTKEPEEGEHLNASVSYGSYDQRRAQVSAGVSDGRLAYLVHGGTDYAESHLALGEKRFGDAFGKIILNQPDGSKLLIDYFALDGRRTIDLSQDFSIVPARYWRIDPWKEEFANVVYSKALDEDATLDFVYYQRDRSFFTTQCTNDSFAITSQTWNESEDDVGVDLRYSVRRDDGTMTRAGYQWARIASDTLQTQYRGPGGPLPTPRVTTVAQERKTHSLFYHVTRPLRPDLRVSLGARYDNPSGVDDALTFSVGMENDLSPRTIWHLHLGTGEENPPPTDGDLVRSIVPPEATTLSAETGVSTRLDEKSRLQCNLFWSDTENARVLYNDPPGAIGPLAYISKAEDLTQWGVEVIYNRRVNDDLSWFVNYTFLREDATNKNPPPIPGTLYPTIAEPPIHIAAAGVRADVGGTRVALNAKYSGDYMALNRLMTTAAPVDSYLVFDLKLSRRAGSGKISLRVDNLLDADYETMPAFPRPGRSYLAEYSLDL